MARLIEAFSQFFDDNGDPLVNGLLKFVESGTNNTDKDTFADINETIANTNPVELDGDGRCPNIFGSGSYNVILYTSAMVQIQQFDPVGGDVSGVAFTDWDAITIYSEGAIVTGSDGLYYKSLSNGNEAQDPTTSADQWEEIRFMGVYNLNITYDEGDLVIDASGYIYRSLADSNLNNEPSSNPDKWGDPTNIAKTFPEKAIWPTISNNSIDSAKDLDFNPGSIPDSLGTSLIALESVMVKQLDAVWAVGANAGGLFTGTVAANTTYHCFVIVKDSDGSVDAGFDIDQDAANIPAGYSVYRRIHDIETDATPDIKAFTQSGDYIQLTDKEKVLDTTSPGTTAVNLQVVPSGPKKLARLRVHWNQGTTAHVYITSKDETDVAAGANFFTVFTASGGVYANVLGDWLSDSSGEIRYRSDVASVSRFTIDALGWTDGRTE